MYALNEAGCVGYSSNSHFVGFGNVAIIKYVGTIPRLKDKFVVVKKMPREGYEFSGKLVFPGGMTRCSSAELISTEIDVLQRQSVIDRIRNETGLVDLAELVRIFPEQQFFSKYTSKGEMRYTEVVVWRGTTTTENLSTLDESVSSPTWFSMQDFVGNFNFAPTNLMILAYFLETQYGYRPEGQVKDAIEQAILFSESVKRELNLI